MTTRTITLELDAYEKLKTAKRGRESFSSVVRRCILPDGPKTGAALLDILQARTALLTEEELNVIESIDRNDSPPASPWEEEA
jgi:predicted CopG family antitoxin